MTDSKTGETQVMEYDADNRLSRYNKKTGDSLVMTQKNKYNGDGRRIQKTEGAGSEMKTRNYYYQNGTVLYTTDGDRKCDSLNLVEISGEVIASIRGRGNLESEYIYNKDVRESISSIIDASGDISIVYDYNEFGDVKIISGTEFDNEFCYIGQVYDWKTDLYYMNARYYSTEQGRFISQDIYRGEVDDPDTYHLYTYCFGNPINFVDSDGYAAKRPKKGKKQKNETLGWGITIQASVGQIISSASVGIDIVWFHKNVDKRYKKKQTHAFWHIDTDISGGLSKKFKKTLKKNNTKVYSKNGLKEIKKSLKKNASFNGAISALYFKIYAEKDKVNSYKDFEGSCKNISFSLAHFTASVGWSGTCKTIGVGVTTSTAGAAGGVSEYYFSENLTNGFRGIFSKKKVRDKARQ